jgi:hypothetical protein
MTRTTQDAKKAAALSLMVAQQRQELLFYLMAWAIVLAWGCLSWPNVQLVLLLLAALCSLRARATVPDKHSTPPKPSNLPANKSHQSPAVLQWL